MFDFITPTIVILDEVDTDKLLRLLYNGERPVRVHTLICLCGAVADLRESVKAWNGWQILPTAKCPACIETRQPANVRPQELLADRREWFLLQLKERQQERNVGG